MVVKTYRGLLADGGQDKIPLSTKDGSVGYRIVKFEVFPNLPGTQSSESTLMIFKESQTTISASTATVDFTNSALLAVAFYGKPATVDNAGFLIVTFDKEIVNQDIYITHTDTSGTQPCNYYIELEQMKLDHTQNMSATLKAIRGSAVD